MASETMSRASNNPGLTACALPEAVGVAIVANPALATVPLLAGAGFGAGGVQAGK